MTTAQDFTDVLVSLTMRWKESSLQFLTTASKPALHGGAAPIWQRGEELAVTLVEEMEVLGTLLTSTGNPLRCVRHRLEKAYRRDAPSLPSGFSPWRYMDLILGSGAAVCSTSWQDGRMFILAGWQNLSVVQRKISLHVLSVPHGRPGPNSMLEGV